MVALRAGRRATCFSAGRFFGCALGFGKAGKACGKLFGMNPPSRNLSCWLDQKI